MSRAKVLRIILPVVIAAAFCIFVSPAESVTLQATPSITLGARWDSNVFNASNFEKSDYVLTAQPGLNLAVGTLGTTFNVRGGMTAEKFLENEELDRTVAAKTFNLYPTDPIQVTPSLQLRPTAYYSDTTDSRGQVVSSPVVSDPAATQGTPVNLTTVSQRAKEKEYAGSLTIIYTPVQKLDLDLRGSALKHEYDESVLNARDFRIYTAGATAYYRFTPKLQVGPSFGFEKMEPSGGADTRVLRESLAMRYIIREGHLLEARGGASQSKQNTYPAVTTDAPYGYIALDSTWVTLHSNISGEYSLANEGVVGAPTKRFLGILRIDNRFSPRTIVELMTSYQKNWLGEAQASQDFSTYTGSLTLRYQLSRWATLRISGNHFNQTSGGTVAGNLKRDSVFLGFDLAESFTIY